MGNVVQAGRRADPGPAGGAVRRAAGHHRRVHGQQGVRLRAEGGDARGPGDQGRRRRRRRRRRHGEHEPGPVPAAEGARTGWKYGDQKPVDALVHDGLWCAFEDWPMGEAAEHIATKCDDHARPTRTASPPRATSGPRPPGRAGRSPPRSCPVTVGSGPKAKTVVARRGHPPRDDRRGAGEAEAGVQPRRHGDGRQRLAAQRRGRGGGRRVRPGGRAARRRSRWPASSPTRRAASPRRTSSSPRCRRCGMVLEKAKLSLARHRPVRAERGVRGPDAGLRQGAGAGRGEGERPRRGDRAGPPDRGERGARAGDAAPRAARHDGSGTAWRRCAWAAATRWRWSWSGCKSGQHQKDTKGTKKTEAAITKTEPQDICLLTCFLSSL